MPPTLYTTYTRQSYRIGLHTSELPNLKENKPRSLFQHLKDLIIIDVIIDSTCIKPTIILGMLALRVYKTYNHVLSFKIRMFKYLFHHSQ
ncbi:MAG: hypothetical protein IPI90_19320 [Saprospiraceae bacterium]|nr:hypothetical protein [Candidatus Vicinibacter affinis]